MKLVVLFYVSDRLKELNLALTQIGFPTLLGILRHCTGLKSLNISRNVSNYQVHRGTNISLQQALQIIELRRRMLEMGQYQEPCTLIHMDPAVWTSTAVRSALQNLPAGDFETFRVVSLSDYCKTKCDDGDDSDEDVEEFTR